jgi:hypothetical protein
MSVTLGVWLAALAVYATWDWVGRRWAFPRLGTVFAAWGILPTHTALGHRAYRVLWYGSAAASAICTVVASDLAERSHFAGLQWALLGAFVTQAIAIQLVVVQATPKLVRQGPRSWGRAILLWVLLASVLWAAWHFAAAR